MAQRGNPGLAGRLLEKSVDAFILALETINHISIRYRMEAALFLFCNAWELLLKARLIRVGGNQSVIYYPKKRGEERKSKALRDCLKTVFTNSNDPLRKNVEMIADLRDQCTHLVVGKIPAEFLALIQSTSINFSDCLTRWFSINLGDRVPIGMLMIVFSLDSEICNLSSAAFRKGVSKQDLQLLDALGARARTEATQLNYSAQYSFPIEVKLALVKSSAKADIVASIGDSGYALSLVEVPKDPSRTHPYRRKEVEQKLKEHVLQSSGKEAADRINVFDIDCVNVVFNIKKNSQYFYQGNVKGSPAQYSDLFVQWLIEEWEKNQQFFSNTRAKKNKAS